MSGNTEHDFGKVLWWRAVAGMLVTTVVSLSLHAVMLQGLHVPYPYMYPKAGWAAYPRVFFSVLGAMYLYPRLDWRFARLSIPLRCLMLFLLLTTIREAFMNIMN